MRLPLHRLFLPLLLSAVHLGQVPDAWAEGAPAAEITPQSPPASAPGEGSGSTPAAELVSPSAWAATVELYGFAPLRTTGTTTVKGFSTDVDLSLGEVLPKLQWATQIRGSLERDRWGLLTDISYVKVGNEASSTTRRGLFTGRAEVSMIQGFYDFALRYRLGDREAAVGTPGQFSLIPYAGIRLVDADLNVEAQIDGPRGRTFLRKEGSVNRTWVQPMIGTQASLFLSPRLRAFARADVGGFGLSGEQDLSGNAQLGLGYAVGNSTQLNLSWRYQGIEYDNGADPKTGYSSYLNGLELGLKVFF